LGTIADAGNLHASPDGLQSRADGDGLSPEAAPYWLPTLFIHGDKDVSAPFALTAGKAVNLATQARLLPYEGAPHGLMLTHAQRLTEDLRAFAHGGAS
jgi:pimeloyl-ACP methyl ester carboxylesterase